ncbi:MAG: hypothetical protein R3E89_18740 [Thiolinea sp.]
MKPIRVVVGGDNLVDDATDPDTVGYDRITVLGLNAALSDASCTMSLIGGNQIGDFGFGGNALDIVQVIQLTHNADTHMWIDMTYRLAIGSRYISGSSNRGFIVAGTGAQSIPIPSDIQPQTVDKTMSAVEDSLVKWTIQKNADPVSLDFGNTCKVEDSALSKPVAFTVSLVQRPAIPGALTATSIIKATNPSSRPVTYVVVDTLHGILDGAVAESVIEEETVTRSSSPAWRILSSSMTTSRLEHARCATKSL